MTMLVDHCYIDIANLQRAVEARMQKRKAIFSTVQMHPG